MERYTAEVVGLKAKCSEAWERAEFINSNERTIDEDESDLKEDVEKLQAKLQPYADLWQVGVSAIQTFRACRGDVYILQLNALRSYSSV